MRAFFERFPKLAVSELLVFNSLCCGIGKVLADNIAVLQRHHHAVHRLWGELIQWIVEALH